ncbi:MAG: sulfoxide reductase heme-binding subunit YedZ [Acidobacteria bacterium]|nr:MAG: sulfoxide reductase heme-binding subunit YedZ [Acidobacteriota bacterium]PYY02784.1 MAG: sulfoxide reductase heme-binding subunit YedZ [Acidobacteriota bacterium]PYY21330.1 MAG: sulfoxide reductase heme-binding subunit YedZ [Acidobacteriota bacterium]
MPRRWIVLLKLVVWGLCLSPVGLLAWKATHDGLGANPLSEITLSTGHWTLYLLLTTLSISPLRKLTGINWLIRFRRLVGLFAFFYGCLHLMTYLWFDKFFDVQEIVKDIYKRPFITAGMTAWTLMLPLALTSTAASIRWLGGRRWQTLHQLIYASGIAGVVHFWWLVKRDLTRPEIMAVILSLLLGFRVLDRLLSNRTVASETVSQER